MIAYLLVESSGASDDYYEEIIKAFSDREKADQWKSRLLNEQDNKERKMIKLQPHYSRCQKWECEKCKEFNDLYNYCEQYYRYSIKEIEVE